MMPICHALAAKFPTITKSCPAKGNVKTQFISTLWNSSRYTAYVLNGNGDEMCTTTISTLTLASMLQDPLIQMVMRSDNVSQEDHSELLYRVQDQLIARAALAEPPLQMTV